MFIETEKAGLIKNHVADLCIVGGGLAGTIAAISAARRGVKVVLMQDRPVLGGNCSSEVRLYIRGAVKEEDRETGILNELEEENIYCNGELSNSVWDSVLLGKVMEEKNITMLCNCSCLDAQTENNKIVSVTGWQLNTYTWHKVTAKYFADCSGDSILAPIVGALFTSGREGRDVYGESLAPEKSDNRLMGMSCLLQAREVDRKVEFVPPKWANVYETDEDIGSLSFEEGVRHMRCDTIGTNGNNLWWMEIGSSENGISDTEKCKLELLKIVYGVWDHIKNRDNQNSDNWELEWVGFLPGKRESRRYIGDHVLIQQDVLSGGKFDDVVAYGGWPLDDHDPNGMASIEMKPSNVILDGMYGIPYRSLYSKNIENLLFAGRNISASHVAFSSTRVLATCALLGQAVGTAVSVCNKYGVTPREGLKYIREIQTALMDDGVYLPYNKRSFKDYILNAKMNITDEQKAVLFNGVERPKDGDNFIELNIGDSITLEFDKPQNINNLRLQFDLDYTRKSISPHLKLQRFAMRMNKGRDFVPVKVANTIVKELEVYADGRKVTTLDNNYYSLVKLPLNLKAQKIEIRFNATRGYDKIRLYGVDVLE